MEFPQVSRKAAHQAKQEKRASVLLQGEGNHQYTQSGKAGRTDRPAESDITGLGAVSQPCSSQGDVQPSGEPVVSGDLAVVEATASEKEHRMDQKEIFLYRR